MVFASFVFGNFFALFVEHFLALLVENWSTLLGNFEVPFCEKNGFTMAKNNYLKPVVVLAPHEKL